MPLAAIAVPWSGRPANRPACTVTISVRCEANLSVRGINGTCCRVHGLLLTCPPRRTLPGRAHSSGHIYSRRAHRLRPRQRHSPSAGTCPSLPLSSLAARAAWLLHCVCVRAPLRAAVVMPSSHSHASCHALRTSFLDPEAITLLLNCGCARCNNLMQFEQAGIDHNCARINVWLPSHRVRTLPAEHLRPKDRGLRVHHGQALCHHQRRRWPWQQPPVAARHPRD